jgi:hypothetical protein
VDRFEQILVKFSAARRTVQDSDFVNAALKISLRALSKR